MRYADQCGGGKSHRIAIRISINQQRSQPVHMRKMANEHHGLLSGRDLDHCDSRVVLGPQPDDLPHAGSRQQMIGHDLRGLPRSQNARMKDGRDFNVSARRQARNLANLLPPNLRQRPPGIGGFRQRVAVSHKIKVHDRSKPIYRISNSITGDRKCRRPETWQRLQARTPLILQSDFLLQNAFVHIVCHRTICNLPRRRA